MGVPHHGHCSLGAVASGQNKGAYDAQPST